MNDNKSFNRNINVLANRGADVGFLKFLKREGKKDNFNELDLPPVPPSIEGFEENEPMPGLEDTKINAGESQDFNLPQQQDFDFSKDMDFDLGSEDSGKEGMPSFPDLEEKSQPTYAQPVQRAPFQNQSMPMTNAKEEPHEESEQPMEPESTSPDYQKATRKYLFPERRHEARKQAFVRADRFKAVLDNISMIRSDLRKSEEALLKLEQMKGAKDRSYDKFKSSLDDLQKKLIFIDKTLFKGE